MDFGKLPDISIADLSLPPDDPANAVLFKKWGNKRSSKLKFYVGCAKWGRPDWINVIYPEGTKEKDFLAHYTKLFNSIELNATFYKVQPRNVTEKWAALADADFRFCPKFTNSISHFKRLQGVQVQTDEFLESCLGYGKKLGSAFLQMSDGFSPKSADVLINYLETLPSDFPVCVELRHKEWFTGSDIAKSTFDKIQKRKAGLVITDTAGRRDCVHQRLTSDTTFIRFVGNNGHITDYERIDDWAARLLHWIDNGIKTVYFFIHSPEEQYSPDLARYAINKINEVCSLNIKPLEIIKKNQNKLF